MGAIDKKGKNFEDYFYKRFILSLRKVRKSLDEHLEEFHSGGDVFGDKASKVIWRHIFFVEILKDLGFQLPEKYGAVDKCLHLFASSIGEVPRGTHSVVKDYVEENKHVAPFENYLNENSKQLSFNFQ